MGNMPSKWVARAGAVASALVAAAISFFVGSWIGDKLAYGFTFDWYVHETHPSYGLDEVFPHLAMTAALSAGLSVLLNAGASAALARLAMRRARYTPPRYSEPLGLDVLGGRLFVGLAALSAFLGVLLAYVMLATPMLSIDPLTGERGVPIERISADGFVLLMGGASAIGGFLGTLVTCWMVHEGVVSGRVTSGSDRNLIARMSIFGMRHAKTTIAAVIGLTLLAGTFASTVNTNVDAADVLPRGDPNTDAAHNLTDKFKSGFTQQVTFQFRVLNVTNRTHQELYDRENAEKLPYRVTEPEMGNITDELYIRAMSQATDFFVRQEPFAGSVAASDLYKLINWTVAGGQDAGAKAFDLPPTTREGELEYANVERGVTRVEPVFTAVDAVVSPTWRQTAVLITVGAEYDGTSKHIGERALEVRDAWVEEVRRNPDLYQVFGPDNPPQFTVDLPLANAHASELTSHDFKVLLPIIAVFIATTLFIAFRNATSVVATFSMLTTAVVWTFGAMGAMDIPLNTLNLAVVPLIMGIGIDYGIHMMNEYQEKRAEGRTPEQAWADAGRGSGLALFVGMLTTVAGLVVMIVSPSLIVAQLGILACIALASCYLLAIVFIPAVVSVMGDRGAKKRVEYKPSRVMPALATGISRTRWAVAIVLLLMAGSAIASGSTIHREAFGDPPRNWLESDPLRQEHERALAGFYDTPNDDVKANILIIEGDVTDPEVHRYISGLTSTLRANALAGSYVGADGTPKPSRVIADTLKDLPFLVNTYLTVRDGLPGAGKYLTSDALADQFASRNFTDPSGQTETYPQTQEEMQALLDEIYGSPLSQFANLFVDAPDYQMTVIVFSVRAATYEDAESVWDEVQAAIAANEALRPEGVQTNFFGNTAINYLFVAKQVPWLTYMSIATNILVIAIVFAFTRDVRATAVVGSLNFLTSTLWLGILPAFGIGLAINLTLPLIFIFAMGSDYGLHLAMRCKRTKDTFATFEGVGKGVLYSFLTTWGSFLVFTQISDLSGRRSMIATSIAIATVFITTLLTVPVFYPVKKKQRQQHEGSRNVPVVEGSVEVWEGTLREVRAAGGPRQ